MMVVAVFFGDVLTLAEIDHAQRRLFLRCSPGGTETEDIFGAFADTFQAP